LREVKTATPDIALLQVTLLEDGGIAQLIDVPVEVRN
jgi:hypothetical protein